MATVILDDVRSAYNVGAIMRTLDGIGGGTVVCCGITPYPDLGDADDRSPVVISANSKSIAKTALGAERTLTVRHTQDALAAIGDLPDGTQGIALEQAPGATDLFEYQPPNTGNFALILGSETDGLDAATLAAVDCVLQIPQIGGKESLNISVAAGIALYHLGRPSL